MKVPPHCAFCLSTSHVHSHFRASALVELLLGTLSLDPLRADSSLFKATSSECHPWPHHQRPSFHCQQPSDPITLPDFILLTAVVTPCIFCLFGCSLAVCLTSNVSASWAGSLCCSLLYPQDLYQGIANKWVSTDID